MPRKARLARDAYQTPLHLACAITSALRGLLPAPRTIIEPSAGEGAFVLAARAAWPAARIIACDIKPGPNLAAAGAAEVLVGDWEKQVPDLVVGLEMVRGKQRVLVVGNPPYSKAQAHVEAALRVLATGEHLAFLLRMGFLEAAKRVDFWRAAPARFIRPIVPRPSFAHGGNDQQSYGLFVWQRGYRGHAELLEPLVWREVA